jgi:hypothetical protein
MKHELSPNDWAKVYERVRCYRKSWLAHMEGMKVLKFNLSLNGQLSLDESFDNIADLIESASSSYQTYLVGKFERYDKLD